MSTRREDWNLSLPQSRSHHAHDLIILRTIIGEIEASSQDSRYVQDFPNMSISAFELLVDKYSYQSKRGDLRFLAENLKGLSSEFKKSKERRAITAVKTPKMPLEFKVFPNLPPEIRLMVWERALPSPRVVELFFSESDVVLSTSKAAHAVLVPYLKVCKESHAMVASKYQSFSAWSLDLKNYHVSAKILLDLTHDIINLPGGLPSFGLLRHFDLSRLLKVSWYSIIQTLALTTKDIKKIFNAQPPYFGTTLRDFVRMTSLKKLLVIFSENIGPIHKMQGLHYHIDRDWPATLEIVSLDQIRRDFPAPVYNDCKLVIDHWIAQVLTVPGLQSLASVRVEFAVLHRDNNKYRDTMAYMVENMLLEN